MKICSVKPVGKRHVFDVEVKENHNFVVDAGVVAHNCTSKGAQSFFKRAKPRSIVDVAALTSIYRPGPLAAHVDQLWMKHEKTPYDWGHPLINETLKETRGLLVFQEDVMNLAHFVGGFPMEKCDEVRRAIMKRSVTGGEEAKKKAKAMEDEFVTGAIGKGVPEKIAKKAYETILFMSGYGFNRSHATGYAMLSYYCAWLLKHHETEWLTAYLESCTSDDDKAEAFSEIKNMGYKIAPIDVNYAGHGWTALPNKRFMPALLTCKGIGNAAVDELIVERRDGFKSFEDFLWDENGCWRWGKVNKTSLEALVKLRAFESLECVGEGRLFNSYKLMHRVLIENMNELRKSPKKDPYLGRNNLYSLIRTLEPDTKEWTRQEMATSMLEILGSVDISQLIPQRVTDSFNEKGVKSIDEASEDKDVHWFVYSRGIVKKSKNNKVYLDAEVMGASGKGTKLKVWAWNSSDAPEPLSLWVAELDKNEQWGCATMKFKMRAINV